MEPTLTGTVSVDQAGQANNATRRDSTQDAISGSTDPADTAPSGQHPLLDDLDAARTEANKPAAAVRTEADLVAPDRTGPGTGDGVDTRPLGDPNAPQGTGPEVPASGSVPAAERAAPVGEVRTSWADQGHTNS